MRRLALHGLARTRGNPSLHSSQVKPQATCNPRHRKRSDAALNVHDTAAQHDGAAQLLSDCSLESTHQSTWTCCKASSLHLQNFVALARPSLSKTQGYLIHHSR